jgi:hypothetical protein
VIGEDALLLMADRLADLDDSLEQAGFTGCLVDRDWMRSHSNPEEWRDFLVYKREYAREVMLSSQFAKIDHSNPHEYQWRSEDIAARVRQRFQNYGDVHALFLDASTRHLTQLTVPAQRLSKVLERASAADVRECERRIEEFNRRRARELQQASNADVLVQGIYEDSSATWAAVQRLFVRMVIGRALGEMRAPGPTCLRLVPMASHSRVYVEFQIEGDPETFAPASPGRMYMTAIHRSPRPAPASSPIRRLHIVPLLPGQFSDYNRFASRAEFVVCFTAWLHVVTHATRALLAANWRLQDGPDDSFTRRTS